MNLTDDEKSSITQAIHEIESKVDAELVTVICQRSDDYYFIPCLWAALVALSFPGVLSIANIQLEHEYLWQVSLFFVIAALLQYSPLKFAVIPSYIKQERASRYAQQLFTMQGIHLTKNNTGILLFVSLDEKYTEIIADKGIAAKVDQQQWQSIIDEFTDLIKQHNIAKAYLTAIRRCGDLLLQYFPSESKKSNQLSDHLIEIY